MAFSVPVSYGLDELVPLSQIHIKQKKSMVNEYMIQNCDGQVLYIAKEDATPMSICCAGKDRKFNIHVFDNQSKELFWVRRPVTWGPDKMEVILASGQVISIVRRKKTYLKFVFHVNDATNKTIFKIKSETRIVSQKENNFLIYTPDGQEVGCIAKLWKGLKREMFCNADDFVIECPTDLDVRYKAAFIAMCFLIDFKLYQ